MNGVVYRNAVLVDTSAALALANKRDPYHQLARDCWTQLQSKCVFCALEVTAHESFTRARYDLTLWRGLLAYRGLRKCVRSLRFEPADEDRALGLLRKYRDKKLSFHDALCAAVMLRHGLYQVFTFDSDFWAFGFQVLPGTTRPR